MMGNFLKSSGWTAAIQNSGIAQLAQLYMLQGLQNLYGSSKTAFEDNTSCDDNVYFEQ